MLDIIFREYDIRGKVGSELLLDHVYELAQAIAYYFVQENPHVKTVIVGMDARSHSPQIKDEVIRALTNSGLNVTYIGICPTPVMYFGLYTLPVDAGLMITASHNPPEYNGIKLCLGKHSVWGLQVKEIRDLYRQKKALTAAAKGTVRTHNLIDDYVQWMARHFSHIKNSDLPLVFDCGNGTAGTVMPELIASLGWSNAVLLCSQVHDAPTHEADPVKEKNMLDVKHALQTTPALLGIGFDGDVDRMAPMTKAGKLISGDQLLGIFSKDVVAAHPGAGVVMDIKSSSGLIELLEKWNAKPYLSPSGHAIIKDQMRKNKALLGGELSCHFFFNDRYFGYDDGIYAALRLVEIFMRHNNSLDGLLAEFPHRVSTNEYRIPCSDSDKQSIVTHIKDQFAGRADVHLITIDGVRATMPYGWGIVRASNTQSELCIRFESDSLEGLHSVRNDFIKALSAYYEPVQLQSLLTQGYA